MTTSHNVVLERPKHQSIILEYYWHMCCMIPYRPDMITRQAKFGPRASVWHLYLTMSHRAPPVTAPHTQPVDYICSLSVNKPHTQLASSQTSLSASGRGRVSRVRASVTNFITRLKAYLKSAAPRSRCKTLSPAPAVRHIWAWKKAASAQRLLSRSLLFFPRARSPLSSLSRVCLCCVCACVFVLRGPDPALRGVHSLPTEGPARGALFVVW